jgi:hypothetical protein
MLTSMEQFLVRYPELALLLAIAAGCWIGSFKIGTFSFGLVKGRRHLARSSNREAIRPLGVGVALVIVLTATDASAQVLTPFRYEYQAQRHCPADTVVWLDFKKRRYYFSSQKLYGSGFHGSFVCLQEARRGNRRSLLGLR